MKGFIRLFGVFLILGELYAGAGDIRCIFHPVFAWSGGGSEVEVSVFVGTRHEFMGKNALPLIMALTLH
jgi:hypothetical protein